MAIACLRLLTVPPFAALTALRLATLKFVISRSTSLEALGEYFLGMGKSSND
jgi:hypothetical protein